MHGLETELVQWACLLAFLLTQIGLRKSNLLPFVQGTGRCKEGHLVAVHFHILQQAQTLQKVSQECQQPQAGQPQADAVQHYSGIT